MRIFLLLIICQLSFSFVHANDLSPLDVNHLKSGDLIFQSLDCGPLCNAIEAVTPAYQGNHFSHVGFIYKKNDSLFIIEAIGKDVHLTPLQQVLQRSAKAVVIGRLTGKDTLLIPAAIQFSLEQSGTPYDDDFLYNNGKYYCSELVYGAFKFAQNGKAYFQLFPMTYKMPGSCKIFPAWIKYFKEKKMAPPEGKPGCNPGSIACSGKLKMYLLQTDN